MATVAGPEFDTLDRLRRELPDDYAVFHNVHWSNAWRGVPVFGEIDFVLVNRSGEVLVIEQKNGALRETGERLFKDYGDSQRDVGRQVHRSMDGIRRKFQWQHGGERRLELGYLLYCPDHRLKRLNAAGLERERVVDAASALPLAARIVELLGPGLERGDGWQCTVDGFFRQSFHLVPDIHAHAAATQRSLTRQTGQLADLLSNLQMTPWRLRVVATAGSGKSLLAASFVARAVDAGRRVAVLCFNRPLRDMLRGALPGALVETFPGFCVAFLRACGQHPQFTEGVTPSQAFWQSLQEAVEAQDVPDDWRFDAIVIDEGQDFETPWLPLLEVYFLRDGGDILWLEDPDQNIRGGETAFEGFVSYRCRVNCRSPASIARFIRNALEFEFEAGNDAPGLGVGVHTYEQAGQQVAIVEQRVADLRRQGFAAADIVILTCGGVMKSVLAAREQLAGLPLRRFTGRYEADGSQVYTAGELRHDSIHRFKGLQAPAVVLVDVDPRVEHLERDLRVVFCGMTRASARLEVLVHARNPECRRFIDA